MSYDIRIVDSAGETVQLPEAHNITGGTYSGGGTEAAWLNITYNYSKWFCKALDAEQGIRWLYDREVRTTFNMLTLAIKQLLKESETFDIKSLKPRLKDPGAIFAGQKELTKEDYEEWDPKDYWAPTPQNAIKALMNLHALGVLAVLVCPDAVWKGD